MQDYSRLLVWQRARALAVAINEACHGISPGTLPGLRSRLLRATLSIGANMAEGASRESRTDFARFIAIALGSADEVEHYLLTCSDLGAIDRAIAMRLIDQVIEMRQMLAGFRRALMMSSPPPSLPPQPPEPATEEAAVR